MECGGLIWLVPDQRAVVVDLQRIQAQKLIGRADAARRPGGGDEHANATIGKAFQGLHGLLAHLFFAVKQRAIKIDGDQPDVNLMRIEHQRVRRRGLRRGSFHFNYRSDQPGNHRSRHRSTLRASMLLSSPATFQK